MKALRLAAALLAAVPASRLAAQFEVTLGPQLVFGEYREVSSDLRYNGGGLALAGSVTWKKFGAEAWFASYQYDPAAGSTAAASFDAKQFDLRLRYYVAGPVSAELGVMSRQVEPEFEAQSVGAVRAGARMSYLLGPGVRMGLRGGLLFGAKFSGGGTSSPVGALELGLGVAVDALKGRLRFTGDYDFQRISRKTDTGSGEVAVPIQQSLGRLGVALAF